MTFTEALTPLRYIHIIPIPPQTQESQMNWEGKITGNRKKLWVVTSKAVFFGKKMTFHILPHSSCDCMSKTDVKSTQIKPTCEW